MFDSGFTRSMGFTRANHNRKKMGSLTYGRNVRVSEAVEQPLCDYIKDRLKILGQMDVVVSHQDLDRINRCENPIQVDQIVRTLIRRRFGDE